MDYIKKFTDHHQEQDALKKEAADYYKMTDEEKAVFDALQVSMKDKEDYYDASFDKRVKKEMKTAKFNAMTEEEKLEYLNKERLDDFSNMKDKVDYDFIDMMAMQMMDFFEIPEEKRDIVSGLIDKWDGTRQMAKDGMAGKM